jgi:hypothetical protein
MAAAKIATLFIDANSTHTLFYHGFGDREAVAISVVVRGLSASGVLNPLGKVRLTQSDTLRHVDGTIGRFIVVQNLAPFNPASVDVLLLSQTF